MMSVKVKICCISSIDEAMMAINAGASSIGLVSEMPSGPGVIGEELISRISKSIPTHIGSFLLTSKQSAKLIIKQLTRCNTNTVQIVDKLVEGDYSEIKNELPDVKIVQVIHVSNQKSIEDAIRISNKVDFLLLDSGNTNLTIKELGGTGRTHDWNLSKQIVQSVKIPVFLAGGLNPDNIIDAVNTVKPYGVDICSGVRTNGKLDPDKLNMFFNNINSINRN